MFASFVDSSSLLPFSAAPRRRALVSGALTSALLVAACSGDDAATAASATEGTGSESESGATETTGATTTATAGTETEGTTGDGGNASFTVRESVEQLHVTHAAPGTALVVLDDSGSEVASGAADDLGSFVFRELAPGEGYVVATAQGDEHTGPLTVMSVEGSQPDVSFYEGQAIGPGFSYITTRDGTTLSVYVTLPGPPEEGPYPTVINYSGYSPSKPGAPIDASTIPDPFDLDSLCVDLPILCDVPNHPSGIIAGLMGYATVGVNMRGTGCSGGAYDYFETLQTLDGYDVVETIAAQPWVQDNRVATVGLSYPGLSQLWVAQTQPPSLAAISPLSVFSDTVTSVLAPGGMFNDGFALSWAENVLDGAAPFGQGWESKRVDAGDDVCAENQLLHGQAVDTIAKALMNPYYTAEIGDPLSPQRFADRIEVPVFTAGAWQDEQTGGKFPGLWDKLTNAPTTRFTGYNGVHADGYTPDVLIEWNNFLGFYLREEIPEVPPLVRTLAPLLFQDFFGEPLEIPPDRFLMFGSYEEALAAYEAEDDVRILFEMGGNPDGGPGIPKSSWEESFPAWPIDAVAPVRWYMQSKGLLSLDAPPVDGGASEFLFNPATAKVTSLPKGDVNASLPPWEWQHEAAGEAAVFVSDALAEDVVMIGPGSVDLWIRSTAEDADLEVNLTEVRPDGQEIYVQSGWLRASHRGLSDESTPLRPIHTHLEEDAAPLVPGAWTAVRVELFPFAHAFRAGSRIRLSVDNPGGSRPEWTFIVSDLPEGTTHAVGHNEANPSSVLLPVVPGLSAATQLPPCPSLRGQPCRAFVDYDNSYVEP
ncbi:MAG: CocE/NonD family hydrolase [Nannocystaceae bacterium]